MPSKDKNEKEMENDKTLMSSKDENEKQNKFLNNDNNANAKNTKNSLKKAANKKKDENEIILLEYIGDIDDKLFKEYSDSKDFNSFINEFDRATNEENKEKVVEELKDMGSFVNHDIERNRNSENSEYISKLINIVNAIDYFLYEYSKK